MFEDEKKIIVSALEKESPRIAATAKKNWKKYSSIVNLLIVKSSVSKSDEILDYGSGHGIVSKLLILLGYKVCAFEPYTNEQIDQSYVLLGITDNQKKNLDDKKQFDLIMLNDVIEHLSVPKFTMEHINRLIKKNGFLIVSTPNVLRFNLWLKYLFRRTGHPQSIKNYISSENNYDFHQREYTMDELIFCLNHFGFKSVFKTIIDTIPSREDTADYSPQNPNPISKLIRSISWMLPNSFVKNNLIVIGKKIEDIA